MSIRILPSGSVSIVQGVAYTLKVKVNVDLYARLIARISPLRRSGVDHIVLHANTPLLPLLRSSPGPSSLSGNNTKTNNSNSRLIVH